MPLIPAVGESYFGPLFAPPAQQFLGLAKDLQHFWNGQYLPEDIPDNYLRAFCPQDFSISQLLESISFQ